MALLIDSSVFIELERRRYPIARILSLGSREELIACAAITISELLLGVHLAIPSPQRDLRRAFIEDVIEAVNILDFNLSVSRRYAEVWAQLRRAGNLIAHHDLLIGATALTHGYAVMTHNLRDFERIPGLEVRQPSWGTSEPL